MVVTNGFITNVLVLIHNMLAIGFVTTVSTLLFLQHLSMTLCSALCGLYFDPHALHIEMLTLYERNAGFAQRNATSREKLRNPGIARQSKDSYFAQRNPKIAQLPGLRGTAIPFQK